MHAICRRPSLQFDYISGYLLKSAHWIGLFVWCSLVKLTLTSHRRLLLLSPGITLIVETAVSTCQHDATPEKTKKVMIMLMNETMSLNCGQQRAYSSPPRWYMKDSHGGMISTEENSSFVHQSSLEILPVVIWYQGGRTGKGINEFGLAEYFVHTCKWFLHAVKFYDMGPPALLPFLRKVCCGFLSPLKSHRLGQVWTREPWGLMSSTLTITSPRRHHRR
jgi:hypothetical protein